MPTLTAECLPVCGGTQVNDRMLGSILRDFLIVLEEHADRSGVVVNATTADITAM